MADTDKKSFPMIAARSWWSLRGKFNRTIPSLVSASYVASALNMTEASANNNVIPALKGTGLIDEEGKPTDLAVKWRDDSQYKEACEKIIKTIYPQEIIDLEFENKDELQRWFANTCRVGEDAARKMASLYLLLKEADPAKATSSAKKEITQRSNRTAETAKTTGSSKVIKQYTSPKSDPMSNKKVNERQSHQIHFNIQIHISPESTPEQIDAIFSSMAKYLKAL